MGFQVSGFIEPAIFCPPTNSPFSGLRLRLPPQTRFWDFKNRQSSAPPQNYDFLSGFRFWLPPKTRFWNPRLWNFKNRQSSAPPKITIFRYQVLAISENTILGLQVWEFQKPAIFCSSPTSRFSGFMFWTPPKTRFWDHRFWDFGITGFGQQITQKEQKDDAE